MRKSTEDGAAGYAAVELAKLGRQAHSAAPQLLAALKHPNVRYAAARALGPVGADSDKAVPALLAMLKDEPTRAGRFAVAGALGTFGPAAASAVHILREELRADGSSEDRGWVAAEAIGKIGGPGAVPALVEALQNKDDQVRTAAIQWLAKRGAGDAAVIEALKKAQKDDAHPWNRKIAAEALKKLTVRPSPATFYTAAKQVPRTPPSAEVKQEADAPDLPSEPPKGDASVPIDPKLLTKLAADQP